MCVFVGCWWLSVDWLVLFVIALNCQMLIVVCCLLLMLFDVRCVLLVVQTLLLLVVFCV